MSILILFLSLNFLSANTNDGDSWFNNFYEFTNDGASSCPDDQKFLSLGNFNPRSSIISSILTLCLPGVIENWGKLIEIDCAKFICKYEATKKGLPTDGCDLEAGLQKCVFTVGEATSFIEGPLIDAVRELINNPVGLLLNFGISASRNSLASCAPNCGSLLITSGWGILLLIDGPALIDRINGMVESLKNYGKTLENIRKVSVCNQVYDIEKELKSLWEAAESSGSGSGNNNKKSDNEEDVSSLSLV